MWVLQKQKPNFTDARSYKEILYTTISFKMNKTEYVSLFKMISFLTSMIVIGSIYYRIDGCLLWQEPVIKGLAILKYCAADVNKQYGLNMDIAENIKKAAEEVNMP